MKKNYILLIFVISLAYSANTHAQAWTSIETDYVFNNTVYTYQTQINAMYKDKASNLWISSYNRGLAKYDGTNWTKYGASYPYATNLPSNIITGIAEDSHGILWFVTQMGISKFDGTNWTTYSADFNNVIVVDQNDTVWSGGIYGLSKFNGTAFVHVARPGETGGYSGNITSLAVDKQNNKWFNLSTYSLIKFDGTNWTTYPNLNGNGYTTEEHEITVDSLGNVWLADIWFGAHKYDGTNWTHYNVNNSGIGINKTYTIYIDHNGNKWFGHDHAVSKFDGTNWTLYQNNVYLNGQVTKIREDAHGNIWFGGSWDSGTNFLCNLNECAPSPADTIIGSTYVCKNSQGIVYTAPDIINATSYFWTLPSGDTITTNTDTLYASFSANAVNGSIKVQGKNSCGLGNTFSKLITFHSCLPATAQDISGASTICQGQQGVVYTTPVIVGADSYLWTYPFLDTITTSTDTLYANFPTWAFNGYLRVQGKNIYGLGNQSLKAVTFNPLPQPPTTITGETTICTGPTAHFYQADTVSGVNAYVWEYTSGIGGTNHSGPFFNIIFDSTATSGYLSIRSLNNCGESPNSASIYINVNHKPNTPGAISGPDAVCANQVVGYDIISPDCDGSEYEWTLPQGITLGWGECTYEYFNFNSDAISGNIVLKAHNDYCGYSDSVYRHITVQHPPDSALYISGLAYVCPYQSNQIYTVTSANDIDSYNWFFPPWVSGSSTTDSIALSFESYSTTIFVQGINTCGYSNPYSYDINVLNATTDAPGWIDGPYNVCFGQSNVVYTVPFVNSATKYIWTLPEGAIGVSDSNSIAVNFGTTTAGSISVKAYTLCGVSIDSSTMDIFVNYKPDKPDHINGADILCAGQLAYYQSNFYGWDVSNYSWTFPQGVSITEGGQDWVGVNYSLDAVSGYVTIRGHNDCGFSDSLSIFITVNHVPDSIYSITGPRNVCHYTGNVGYTVPQASNVDNYTWNMPDGFYGWSQSNTIQCYISNNSGVITVQAYNACGESPISNVYINVINSIPDQVQTITGLTDVCAGQTNVVYNAYSNYNMDTITNALMYIWTFPSGIIDTTNTYILNTTISANEVGGNITVQPVNSCGYTNYAQIAINVNHIPAKPDYFSGTDVLCAGQQALYQSNFYGWDISSYSWTIPQGTTITDGGLDWIGLTFNSNAVSGDVIFKAHNECGFSDSIFMHVTVNHPPDSIYPVTGPRDVCQYTWDTYTVPSASNIDYYTWSLPDGVYGWGSSNSIPLWFNNTGIITVQGHNSCGDSPITPFQVTVLNAAPDVAGSISGLTTVSQSQTNVIYTVPPINNATAYTWTLPNGETTTSLSDSIIVNFTYQTSGNITVKGTNPCGDGSISSLFVNVVPSASVNLKIKSSSDTTCQGNSITYTATCSNGGNNPIYNWYVNDVLVSSDSNYINDLVAYYPFNNNANDESGNSNNGTVNGATLTTDRFGNPNSAYYFGDNNYIKASANNLPTNDRTVSLWFKANSTASMPTLLGYGGSSCGQSYMMMLNVCGWGENYFYAQSHCNDNALGYLSPDPITPTSWYHWVITTEGTVEKMYLNGVLASINYNFNTPTYVDSKDLSIGVNVDPTGYAPYTDGCTGWFDGSIDDIRIYKHALTDLQVSNLYNITGKSTFTYTPSNNDHIKCIVTTSSALPDTTIATSNIITMKVNPLPDVPASITGPTLVNQGQNNVTYSIAVINNTTSYVWTLPSGVTGNYSNTNSIVVDYGNNASSGNITVKGHNSCGDGSPVSLPIYVTNTYKTIYLTAMFQEYYNSSTGIMNQTLGIDWITGDLYKNFPGTIVDTVTVLIRKTNITPDVVSSFPIDTVFYGVNLNNNGLITISLSAGITGYHYIEIKHRNSIETWSDSVNFSTDTIKYDFYNHISQFALDNGMLQDGTHAWIWGGDVNQNGNLESADAAMIYVAANSDDPTVNNGYVICDIDGNGNIDSQDYGMAYNNANLGANVINPFSYLMKK